MLCTNISNNLVICLLLGNVEALMDVWILGDNLLREIFHTFQSLKTSADRSSNRDRHMPYIYSEYNVFFFFMAGSSAIQNFLTKITNVAVEAFNRRDHLPKHIIIIPDEDLIISLNFFAYGSSYLIGTCVNWLSKQLERMMDARIEDLHSKRLGAFYENTKLIWVKMFPWLVNLPPRLAKVMSLRHKLNLALDELSRKRKQTHVLSITSLEHAHFDQWGKLNYQGKMQFWRDLDDQIKHFDSCKTNLLPQDQNRGRAMPLPPRH